MADLNDGETTEVKGSGKTPYVLRNIGGVYDCSCVAWKMQSHAIDIRTCKHLVTHRGAEAEVSRVGHDNMPTAWKKKNPLDGVAAASKTEKGSKKAAAPKPVVTPKEVPEILLAHKWDGEQDIAGWWMSEKLDGVRAYWDGTKFLSRLGNVYHAPAWFTEGFPSFPLDGELFVGRGLFQDTVSIVRRHNAGDLWKKVKYLVFDTPGFDKRVEDRFKVVNKVVEFMPYGEAVAQSQCKSIDYLMKALTLMDAAGGEGLMLRQPESLYEAGRSHSLLKVKTFHDAEATVTGYTKGKGRHKGRCGALEVRAADGTEFKVGTGMSDAQRDNPPMIGATITYRYQELTNAGVPRFPSFVRERHDVAH